MGVVTLGLDQKKSLREPRITRLQHFVMLIHLVYTKNSYFAYFHILEFIWSFLYRKLLKLVFLPPVLAQKWVIRAPRIPQLQRFVMLIHLLYTQNSYFAIFSDFRIHLDLFVPKTPKIGIFTPGFGPKKGHKGT